VCDVFSAASTADAWAALAASSARLDTATAAHEAAVDRLLSRDRRDVPVLTLSVVLVHDDDHVREPLAAFLREQLADLHASVVEASCVAEGLGEILLHQPRVVVVDYHLGDETGVDLMRAVGRARFELGRGIRYVLVSGRVDIESLAPIAEDLHAEAWSMRTPTTEAELRALVARVRDLLTR
jgi:CheY-like chemotaxis protein